MFVRSLLAGITLLTFSVAALAFEAVDILTPSTSGRYLAYPAAPLPLSEFWVRGGVMFDSNVLRTTRPPPTETEMRLGVGGRKDTYVYGRQMVRLAGNVDGYLFNRFSELDNLGFGGLAEWHWELGNDFSGVLGATTRRYQRDLALIQAPVRDMVTENHYLANGAYRLGPSFRARAGVDVVDFKDPVFYPGGVQTVGGVVGLDYVTALGNTLGIEYRRARGDAPVAATIDPTRAFVGNTFDEHTVALAATYLNAFFRLNGNIGRTHRTYDLIPGHDFDGTTWRAAAEWLVTPKTALGLETYYLPNSVIMLTSSNVLVRGVAFGPGWAPTEKLNFTARVMRERQDYSLEPGLPGPPQLDILHDFRIGAYWEYTRQIHWTFAIDHGERDSNILGRDYKYNAFIANVRYLFW